MSLTSSYFDLQVNIDRICVAVRIQTVPLVQHVSLAVWDFLTVWTPWLVLSGQPNTFCVTKTEHLMSVPVNWGCLIPWKEYVITNCDQVGVQFYISFHTIFFSQDILLVNFEHNFISIVGNKYCQANPSSIVAHPANCAQYFNCSQRNTRLGGYLLECPYPLLFSTVSNSCQNFTITSCNSRFEPQAPC